MKEAVDDIMVTLNEAASEGGMVGGMVESIAESMGRVSTSLFSGEVVCVISSLLVWFKWMSGLKMNFYSGCAESDSH